jgi:hypothetical protein
MGGSGSSSGEGCLVSRRDLARSFLFPGECVLSDERKSALQFGSKVGRLSSDLNRLASGFASKPVIQVIRRCLHPPTLVGDWRSRLCLALGYGCGLTQELCDLLPSVQ